MFQVTLTQVNFPVKNFFVPRDDPKIWRLYNGLSCTELCNGDEGQCVVPSTPGNITSACPIGAAKQFPRRVAKRKTREGDEKETNDNGMQAIRLVGPSTLHTHERTQALRYPWICSLKTQGFRWNMITSEKLFIQGSPPLCIDPSLCATKRNNSGGDRTLQLHLQKWTLHSGALLLQTTWPT